MFIKSVVIASLATTAVTADAALVSLVKNGGFETFTTTNPNATTGGEFGRTVTVADWSSNGYNFVFGPGTADTTGSYTSEYSGYLTLWGPNNGAANGLPASSPAGGNFVGADGAFQVGAITQMITGLTTGNRYLVGFDWAGAQQNSFTGGTTEQWIVSLGGESRATPVLQNASHGFTGWQHTGFAFTATGASETLSFLAVGTPDGEPPFSLLDGVTLTAVPEAASWAMLMTGFGLVGFAARRRRVATVVA